MIGNRNFVWLLHRRAFEPTSPNLRWSAINFEDRLELSRAQDKVSKENLGYAAPSNFEPIG